MKFRHSVLDIWTGKWFGRVALENNRCTLALGASKFYGKQVRFGVDCRAYDEYGAYWSHITVDFGLFGVELRAVFNNRK